MNVPEYFGCMVFNDTEMKKRLTEDVYLRLRRTMDDGRSLDPGVADEVASAMKEWALERGATHFSHWLSLFLKNLLKTGKNTSHTMTTTQTTVFQNLSGLVVFILVLETTTKLVQSEFLATAGKLRLSTKTVRKFRKAM